MPKHKFQTGGAAGKMPPLPAGGSQPVPYDKRPPGIARPIGSPRPSVKPPTTPPKLMDDSFSGRLPPKGQPKPGPTNPLIQPRKKMAKGGSASKRADGCVQRGKTKGKMI